MVETKFCVDVWSDSNMDSSIWVDLCIVPHPMYLIQTENIVKKAYSDWWELSDAQSEPLVDYISKRLQENGIEFEIYFKDKEEE